MKSVISNVYIKIIHLPLTPKRPRKPIQNSQRKIIRAWYYDDSNQPSMGRSKLKACRWWQQTYGYHLNSFTASEIISVKWARLDNEAI